MVSCFEVFGNLECDALAYMMEQVKKTHETQWTLLKKVVRCPTEPKPHYKFLL